MPIPSDPISILLQQLQLGCKIRHRWRLDPLRPIGSVCLTTPGFLIALDCTIRIQLETSRLLLEPGQAWFILENRGAVQADLHLTNQSFASSVIIGDLTGSAPHLGHVIGIPPTLITSAIATRDDITTTLCTQLTAIWADNAPGSLIIMEQLVATLLLHSLRKELGDSTALETGWLHALSDPDIGPILSEMLQSPERGWSVESLAAISCLARSSFARRFRDLLKSSPIEILTRIRMTRAQTLLSRGLHVQEVARQVGYRTSSSFSDAFKRFTGLSPQKFREIATSSPSSADEEKTAAIAPLAIAAIPA